MDMKEIREAIAQEMASDPKRYGGKILRMGTRVFVRLPNGGTREVAVTVPRKSTVDKLNALLGLKPAAKIPAPPVTAKAPAKPVASKPPVKKAPAVPKKAPASNPAPMAASADGTGV